MQIYLERTEYQTILNFLENTNNQSLKFRTTNWLQVNYDMHETCITNSQIKFKITMLRLSLCDFSDRHILLKKAIAITGAGADAAERRGGKETSK